MDKNYYKYYKYLLTRSRLAFIYRSFYIYRKINKFTFEKTLDVGCGIGDYLRTNKNAVGVDINPYLVEHCQKIGLNAHIMEVDKLPFNDDCFSSIVLDNVLEHIEKPNTLLNEIKRVIRKNGLFIVGVPGSHGYIKDPDHKKYYDQKSLNNLIKNYHFECLDFFASPFISTFLDKKLKYYCLFGVYKSIK